MIQSSHLTAKQRKSLETVLRAMQQDLQQRIQQSEHLGLSQSMRDETGELSTNDNHPADLGSEMFERGKDIALLENEEQLLEKVTFALDRIHDEDFGICHDCGKPIPFARLQAVPYTLYCVKHAIDQAKNNRPVEEQFLTPPFGRTSLDDQDQTGFDGEDAWQIVESWGTSNTPAMAEDNNVHDYDEMYIEAAEELDGFVESFESFIATDIYGQNVSVIRSRQYQRYLDNQEGDPLLEPELTIEDE